ncbi:YqjF family protein [Rubrobacter aplysinae]|uniref:YqjF family protein n=1 Tax=Rubrobacter aplysinae TaxID=909625 RepID=UPI000A955B24|nr:DUF2071 domain-containing protein [Rubrobacter aplysinae]
MPDGAENSLLERGDHRPYPPPEGRWALSMRWHDLLFMHWPVGYDALRPLIPPALDLDTFDGSAWLGVVPFRMSGVSPRYLPGVPHVSDFPELNLRTYVTAGGKPGIWFFSLDAHNPLAVRLARATFSLPYYDAAMSCRPHGSDGVDYRSVRTHRRAHDTRFTARYRPTGPPVEAGDLERFLTDRYCLYAADSAGRLRRGEIHHDDWRLQPAEAEVSELEMTGQIGLKLPDSAPLLHFSRRLEVVAWAPRRVGS